MQKAPEEYPGAFALSNLSNYLFLIDNFIFAAFPFHPVHVLPRAQAEK
jgi:hypothetical protein